MPTPVAALAARPALTGGPPRPPARVPHTAGEDSPCKGWVRTSACRGGSWEQGVQ